MSGETGARRTAAVWKWVSLLLLPAAFALSVWAAGAPPSSSGARTARAITKGFQQQIVARGFPTAFLTPTNTATNTPTNTPTSTATNTPTNTPTSTATATAIVSLPTAPEIPTLSEVGTALLILCLLGVAVLHLLRTRQ